MKCRGITRKNSNLPPFMVDTCAGQKKKGKDGLYEATERANGVFFWKQVKDAKAF